MKIRKNKRLQLCIQRASFFYTTWDIWLWVAEIFPGLAWLTRPKKSPVFPPLAWNKDAITRNWNKTSGKWWGKHEKKIYILGKINIETKQWKNYKITKTFRNFKVNNILDHSNRDRGAGYKSGPNKPLKIIFYKQLGGILAISLIGNYKIKDARIISN